MNGLNLTPWDWQRIAEAVEEVEEGDAIRRKAQFGTRWSVETAFDGTVMISIRAGEAEA